MTHGHLNVKLADFVFGHQWITSLTQTFNSFHRFTLSFTLVGRLRYSPQFLYYITLDKGRSKGVLLSN